MVFLQDKRYPAIRLGNYEKIMGMEWFFEKYVLQRHNNAMRSLLNFTQKLDSFGETLFFYPVANTFSQTNRQIPKGNNT